MYLELKRLDTLKASELPQVATPFYAVGQLKSARAGYLHIRGFEEAWKSCTGHSGPFNGNDREQQGFDRLRQAVEQGDWVLVLDKSWPPISPAFQQVNDEWQPTHQVHSTELRHRLTRRAQTLEREQREWEALQSRNLPSSAPVVEPAAGPGNRAASLGPHVGANENKSLANENPSNRDDKSNSGIAKGFPVSDKEAEKTFTQALADQKVMLEAKKLELEKWDAAAQADFKTWFGTTNEADREIIRDRIDKTLALNKSYDISKFQPSSPKNKDAYAYVNPNDAEHRIYLGDPFWSAPATGADSKAGILSHEMSHFNDVGGTDDFAYGADDAKQLAKDNPAQALHNADNFEFYLENAK